MKKELKEFRDKLTPSPWNRNAMQILFVRNQMKPTCNLIQPTAIDLEFIEFVRNHLDDIIDALPD